MPRNTTRGAGKKKKRTAKSSPASRDLAPKKSLRAGAVRRVEDWRLAGNHNETLVRVQ